jgi:hypothetical protein
MLPPSLSPPLRSGGGRMGGARSRQDWQHHVNPRPVPRLAPARKASRKSLRPSVHPRQGPRAPERSRATGAWRRRLPGSGRCKRPSSTSSSRRPRRRWTSSWSHSLRRAASARRPSVPWRGSSSGRPPCRSRSSRRSARRKSASASPPVPVPACCSSRQPCPASPRARCPEDFAQRWPRL